MTVGHLSEATAAPSTLRGTLVADGRVTPDAVVETDGGVIAYAGAATSYRKALPPRRDQLIMPGLIDVHCHGGGGAGFPDGGLDAAMTATAHHQRAGTTTMLASLVSAPIADLLDRVRTLATLVESGELAGIHLEGPFIARSRCGAQDPRHIVDGDPGAMEQLLVAGRGAIRSVTLAPETAHFDAIAAMLVSAGVVVSLGHSSASVEVARRAIDLCSAGRLSATHLFNGMEPLHHRAPGLVGASLQAAGRGEMTLELISDGVHLAPETVSMVFDLVGADQIALVSDAMAAAGMPDGEYTLGPADVTVSDGIARLRDDSGAGAIAGGTSTVLGLIRTAVDGGVDLASAVTAATSTPARLLGLTGRGRLAPGDRADIVVTDPDLAAHHVMVDGKWTEVTWR